MADAGDHAGFPAGGDEMLDPEVANLLRQWQCPEDTMAKMAGQFHVKFLVFISKTKKTNYYRGILKQKVKSDCAITLELPRGDCIQISAKEENSTINTE